MQHIEERERFTDDQLTTLMGGLERATTLAANVACVCMTGSYGRREAGAHSDLDLFIVGIDKEREHDLREEDNPHTEILGSRLSGLDEICLKAELIRAAETAGIRKFDADGRYLAHYSVSDLVGRLGQTDDDMSNALTSRLLLLLEGRPLIGGGVFESAIDRIIQSYWRDFVGRETDFTPAFVANDILRLWRTFCVNYEARTAAKPEIKRLRRRVKNYKLKFSRLLTCYSALLHLLHIFGRRHTVTPFEMKEICRLSPLDRIRELRRDGANIESHQYLDTILSSYDSFLGITDADEDKLIEKFRDDRQSARMLDQSYDFAHAIFRAVETVGGGSRLHRMIVV